MPTHHFDPHFDKMDVEALVRSTRTRNRILKKFNLSDRELVHDIFDCKIRFVDYGLLQGEFDSWALLCDAIIAGQSRPDWLKPVDFDRGVQALHGRRAIATHEGKLVQLRGYPRWALREEHMPMFVHADFMDRQPGHLIVTARLIIALLERFIVKNRADLIVEDNPFRIWWPTCFDPLTGRNKSELEQEKRNKIEAFFAEGMRGFDRTRNAELHRLSHSIRDSDLTRLEASRESDERFNQAMVRTGLLMERTRAGRREFGFDWDKLIG